MKIIYNQLEYNKNIKYKIVIARIFAFTKEESKRTMEIKMDCNEKDKYNNI